MGIFQRRAAPTTAADGSVSSATFGHRRAITAAAQQFNLTDKNEVDRHKELRGGVDDWQTQAWDYYDVVGEIKYSAGLVGSVMSRVNLYAAGVTSEDTVPSPLHEIDNLPEGLAEAARDALRMLKTANGGVPGLLHDLAINLFVAGEAYLVRMPARLGSGLPESWKIMSIDQLVPTDARGIMWAVKTRRTSKKQQYEELPQGTYISRIWRMHPRYSDEADSSLRALLDPLDELLLLNRTARGTARSRLNAGLLYIPDGISISAAADGAIAVEDDGSIVDIAPLADDETDDIAEQLLTSMTTPIENEADASAVVPLILRGPDDLGEKIKLITFERSFDPQLTQRADKLLDRILAGLDLPKDIITGLASVKYSNAVQIEESLYKTQIEPLALLICDALTVGFLHPVLKSQGFTQEQIDQVVVWYDPSAITTKPGRAEAANTGYDSKIISADAWRRAHGFSDTDAPDPEEVAVRIAIERGPLSEPVAEALLRLLIPNLMDTARDNALGQSAAPIPSAVETVLDGAPTPAAPAADPTATTGADPLAEGAQPVSTATTPTGLIEP